MGAEVLTVTGDGVGSVAGKAVAVSEGEEEVAQMEARLVVVTGGVRAAEGARVVAVAD